VVLLVTAGLLLRSVYHSYALDPGFDVQETAFLQFDFDGRDSGPAEFLEMGKRLESRLGSLSGVVSTARARTLPALGNVRRNLVWRPGETFEEGQSVTNVEVSPEYFRTMGIPLIEGRTFDQGDGPETEPVAIASESLVRELLGGGEALSRSVVFSMLTRVRGGRIVAEDDGVPLRIVGVVGDVRQARLTSPPEPVLYLSMAQGPTRKHSIVMRTSGDPEDVLSSVRDLAREAGDAVMVKRMGTLKTALRQPLALLRVRTTLAVVLAGLAGLLTVVGIYGVVAHVVADSVHEIGIRMALGARRGGEVRRAILQALRPVSMGVVVGLAGAVLASPLVEHSLFGVEPMDPVTYGWVPAFLIAVAALAAWIPARRAAAVDPIRVLNEE
jgi:predicted permease